MFERIRTLFCTWTPWEKRLLATLAGGLAGKHRDILTNQIAAVNKVQRLLEWVEIDVYCMRHGRVSWDDVPKFFDEREFVLARASTFIGGKRIQSQLSCGRALFQHRERCACEA